MTKLMGFLVVVCLFGCATSSHVITGSVHPAISPDAVTIYYSMPAGAEEIALLDGSDPWRQKTDRAIKAMKEEASRIGANGIVIDRTSTGGFDAAEIEARAIYVH